MATREQLVKYAGAFERQVLKLAGYWGNLTGSSVRAAEKSLAELPRMKERLKEETAKAHEQLRGAVFDAMHATPRKKVEPAREKLWNAFMGQSDRLDNATVPRSYDAGDAYRAQHIGKVRKAEAKFKQRDDTAYAASQAQAARSDPAVRKAKTQKVFLKLVAKAQQRAEQELPGRVTALTSARSTTRLATGGALGAAALGGMALRGREAARIAKWRRNLAIGGAGVAGLGGLAAYKKRDS